MCRQIFADGRPLPADPNPAWNGYSVGRREGETLVVLASSFKDGQWLDFGRDPLTDAAKITERFRRPDFGHLQIEITVDDSKTYTRPFTFTLNEVLLADIDLLEMICAENEKDLKHLSTHDISPNLDIGPGIRLRLNDAAPRDVAALYNRPKLEPGMYRSILILFVLLSVSVSLSAQWLDYPTPGMPRTPDGKPNLSAPAPRTADGKPDLSGVWAVAAGGSDGYALDPTIQQPGPNQFLDIAPDDKGQPYHRLPYKPGVAQLAQTRAAPPKNYRTPFAVSAGRLYGAAHLGQPVP